jgi:MFS family permease
VSKPFYTIAASWPDVLAIRFGDRFGKGIRSAPRDVLIADTTEPSVRGRAFGFHRAMDTAGATMGPLLALLLVWLFVGGSPEQLGKEHRSVYTVIFIAAAVPAVLGWLVLTFFVRERRRETTGAARPEIRISGLGRRFTVFLAIVTLFSMGNSSDAFLVLRARSAPIDMGFITFLWVYVAFNAVSAVVALRSGVLSDRIGRKPVIVAGWLVFSLVYFAVARVTSPVGIWVWFTIYGFYYGMTEGLLRAYAVDLAPAHLRGSAVGAYYTFSGVALLPASLIAGLMWDKIGPSAPFYYGGSTALLAAVLLAVFAPSHPIDADSP